MQFLWLTKGLFQHNGNLFEKIPVVMYIDFIGNCISLAYGKQVKIIPFESILGLQNWYQI